MTTLKHANEIFRYSNQPHLTTPNPISITTQRLGQGHQEPLQTKGESLCYLAHLTYNKRTGTGRNKHCLSEPFIWCRHLYINAKYNAFHFSFSGDCMQGYRISRSRTYYICNLTVWGAVIFWTVTSKVFKSQEVLHKYMHVILQTNTKESCLLIILCESHFILLFLNMLVFWFRSLKTYLNVPYNKQSISYKIFPWRGQQNNSTLNLISQLTSTIQQFSCVLTVTIYQWDQKEETVRQK